MQTKRRDLRLAWSPPRGGVNLCEPHAAGFEAAGARVLRLMRLK